MGDGLDAVVKASACEKNLVVSPSGLKAAKYLEKTFGIPYETGYPIADDFLPKMDYTDKKILIVHQQVMANALRDEIRRQTDGNSQTEITAASWFSMKAELNEAGDISLKEEEDYIELIENGNWDIIFADKCMARMTPKFAGIFIDIPHFAVSGRLAE